MSLPRYPEYKDCGIGWLGPIPRHWQVRRLKFLFDLMRRPVRDDDEIVTAFRDGQVTLRTKRRRDGFTNALQEIGYQGVRDGDLVIHAMDAFAGAIGVSDSDGKSTPVYSVCSPRGDVADSHYYAHLLRHMALGGFINSLAKGIRERSTDFRWSDAGPLFLPLPPLLEQRSIIAFLDRETAKIDALIAEQEKLLALLAEKRQATISHAVTRGLNPSAPMKDSGIPWLGEVPAHWEVTKCGRFLSVLSGFAFPSSGFDHSGNGTRLLRGVNVSVGTLRWEDVVYWERAPEDGLDAYELKAGDLVMGMDRPLIAAGVRVAKVKEDDVPSLLLQRVALLRTSKDLDSDFLMRWLSTPMFVAHFAPETTGVSVPHISPEQIASFVIAIPPVDEQQRIISFLERESTRIDLLIGKAERAIGLLKERRSALIAAAVTGQIDVRRLVAAQAA